MYPSERMILEVTGTWFYNADDGVTRFSAGTFKSHILLDARRPFITLPRLPGQPG